MTSRDIENNVSQLFEHFSEKEFIYDFLVAYGISKTSVTRLKKGDFNLSKVADEILYKKKIYFKPEKTEALFVNLEALSIDERITKHSPRFLILTDYKTLIARDMKTGKNLDISLHELPRHFDFFLPLSGSEVYNTRNDNKADREAAYKMAELYDNLRTANPDIYNSKESIHRLNIFLSRLLFCFFAEDTGIFEEEGIFTKTLVQHTADNGNDTHQFLDDLFNRLNSSNKDLFPMYLSRFPYVNGGLFRDPIQSPVFTFKARKTLIELGDLQWQDINPDIFGSMIQAVVLPEYRSDFGMHYTSVENILKLIKPLFLDELYEEFEKNSTNIQQLRKLIFRISKIKFLDPACGSGNFLIITYKEIRLLEIKILQRIIELTTEHRIEFTQIQLSQFYGIELDDFAHEMAILSLWLAEHQMNKIFEEMLYDYGRSKPILPLKQAGHIVRGNATRIEWKDVCPVNENDEVYIIGNPPYFGARVQDTEQKSDMGVVFRGIRGYNNMDYISCWFLKAKNYISEKKASAAFVSTNSICQGEQVALLWPHLLNGKIEISFAYNGFKWTNNAKGNAGVTVIIIGLRNITKKEKYLFEGNIKKQVKNINPYLLDYDNIYILGRSKPLSNFPDINFGNMANDNGHLLLSKQERDELLNKEPEAHVFIKKLVGALEFIRGIEKYCIWIEEEQKELAYSLLHINERIEKTKQARLKSKRPSTQELSVIPYKFAEIRYLPTESIIIPSVSSEKRDYIPIGFLGADDIIVAPNFAVYHAQPWLFAVLTSRIHMVWVRTVGGRLKTDYRYSAKLCYNTFPFPNISEKLKETLKEYVLCILDERAKYPEKTMAQLYDPDSMPAGLRLAHQQLDEAVERCYRLQPFSTDTERLEYLFRLYEEMIQKDTLFAKQKKKQTRKNKQ